MKLTFTVNVSFPSTLHYENATIFQKFWFRIDTFCGLTNSFQFPRLGNLDMDLIWGGNEKLSSVFLCVSLPLIQNASTSDTSRHRRCGVFPPSPNYSPQYQQDFFNGNVSEEYIHWSVIAESKSYTSKILIAINKEPFKKSCTSLHKSSFSHTHTPELNIISF